jgi:hypothetical protein
MENDDADESAGGVAWNVEACIACHNSSISDKYPRRNCEDCHLTTSAGPYADNAHLVFRSDWRESMPIVYEHIFSNISYTNSTGNIVYANDTVEVNSGNVSSLVGTYEDPPDTEPITNSTCLGWNNGSMTGVCHGVSWQNTSDGYYAFSNKSGVVDLASIRTNIMPQWIGCLTPLTAYTAITATTA